MLPPQPTSQVKIDKLEQPFPTTQIAGPFDPANLTDSSTRCDQSKCPQQRKYKTTNLATKKSRSLVKVCAHSSLEVLQGQDVSPNNKRPNHPRRMGIATKACKQDKNETSALTSDASLLMRSLHRRSPIGTEQPPRKNSPSTLAALTPARYSRTQAKINPIPTP